MQRPDWYPSELAYAGEEHLDPDYVASYDAKSAVDHTDDLATLREASYRPIGFYAAYTCVKR